MIPFELTSTDVHVYPNSFVGQEIAWPSISVTVHQNPALSDQLAVKWLSIFACDSGLSFSTSFLSQINGTKSVMTQVTPAAAIRMDEVFTVRRFEHRSNPPGIVALGRSQRAESAARSARGAHPAAQTPSPSTTATSVVAISRVRREKRVGKTGIAAAPASTATRHQ
jgi:hypothetical protein